MTEDGTPVDGSTLSPAPEGSTVKVAVVMG